MQWDFPPLSFGLAWHSPSIWLKAQYLSGPGLGIVHPVSFLFLHSRLVSASKLQSRWTGQSLKPCVGRRFKAKEGGKGNTVQEASVGEREVPSVLQGQRGFGASGSASAAKAAGARTLEFWAALLLKILRNVHKNSHTVSALSNVHVCTQTLLSVCYLLFIHTENRTRSCLHI